MILLIALFASCTFSCNWLTRYDLHPAKQILQKNLKDLARLVSKLPIEHNPLCALDEDGRSIVHHCTLHNQPERVQLCLSLQFLHGPGIDVNQKDKNGYTPLHLAATCGHASVATVLLQDPHIDVHAVDHNGKTALHLAVVHNRIDVVNKLVNNESVEVNRLGRVVN